MFGLSIAWLAATAHAGIQVAVLKFDGTNAGEYAQLSSGLQALVTTDLASTDDLVVLERARLQDLLGELEFNQSQYVDPATAQKIGKVVGATHVVSGTYTILGAKMAITANLVDVTTGKVVVPAQINGETEAFFELEKELVKILLTGLGAVLSPKERADIARIQTADLQHLLQFSEAVSLYDDDRYNESVAILERLSADEPTFTLASMTLTEIREVQRQVEEKAMAARNAERGQEFVAHQAAAQRDATLVERLREIGADPARTFQDRATANLLLVQLGELNQLFGALKDSADEFALRRLGERAYQAAWAELRPKVPQWFPVIDHPDLVMDQAKTVDEIMAWNRGKWFEIANENNVFSSCKTFAGRIDLDEELTLLWVPARRRLDLRREILEASKGCMSGYESAMRDLADEYTDAGLPGPSTAILQALSAGSSDPRFLESLVPRVQENAELQQVLEGVPAGATGRELLLPVPRVDTDRVRLLKEGPDKVLERLSYYVRSAFDHRYPFFVNGIPTWIANGKRGVELQTGPRTSADETRSIRHYRDLGAVPSYGAPKPEAATILVLGGTVKGDLTAKVAVDYRPAADWWPRQAPDKPAGWAPLPDRPAAGLLFGLREIKTDPVCDPLDPAKMTPIPATGYAAMIQKGQLVLAEVVEVWPEPDRCGVSGDVNLLNALVVKTTLASKPLTKPTAEITLTVKDRTVTASAAGVTVTATLKVAPSGFVALYADGNGYVELRDPGLQ